MADFNQDRLPTSNIITKSLTGTVTILKAASSGEIDFGEIPRDVGYFSGRITITGIEAAPMTISVGWGCDEFPRTLPIYVDTIATDYDEGVYIIPKLIDATDLTDAQQYIFFLVDPANPKPIPLIPEGSSFKFYLGLATLVAASIKIDVEFDYEAGDDFNNAIPA